MLKETIKYVGFDGEAEETLYFNLTKVEAVELRKLYSTILGVTIKDTTAESVEELKKIVEEVEPEQLVQVVKTITKQAFGLRSEDGRRFIKNESAKQYFEESIAVSEFLEQLIFSKDRFNNFVAAIMPKFDIDGETEALLGGGPSAYKPEAGILGGGPSAYKEEGILSGGPSVYKG